MCFQLITIQYTGNQYNFVSLDTDNQPSVIVNPGSYVILFHSQDYSGYFRPDIQKIAEQIIANHNGTMVSAQSPSQPVLYYLNQ